MADDGSGDLESRVQVLEFLVSDLLQLHVDLRDGCAELRGEHSALADSLCRAGYLTLGQIRRSARARRRNERLRDVLRSPVLAHAVGDAAGSAAVCQLSGSCRSLASCMTAAAAAAATTAQSASASSSSPCAVVAAARAAVLLPAGSGSKPLLMPLSAAVGRSPLPSSSSLSAGCSGSGWGGGSAGDSGDKRSVERCTELGVGRTVEINIQGSLDSSLERNADRSVPRSPDCLSRVGDDVVSVSSPLWERIAGVSDGSVIPTPVVVPSVALAPLEIMQVNDTSQDGIISGMNGFSSTVAVAYSAAPAVAYSAAPAVAYSAAPVASIMEEVPRVAQSSMLDYGEDLSLKSIMQPRQIAGEVSCVAGAKANLRKQQSYIYIVGGRNAASADTTVAERFNTFTAEWEKLPPMLTARSLCSAAVINGQVYVVGGCRTGRPLTTCERYDPDRNQWESLPRMVTVRNACSAAAVGGKLYVANRRVSNLQCPATCERFDPATGKWQVLPLTATPYNTCNLAAVEGQLYAVLERGGNHTVERFELGSSCWEQVPPKPASNDYTFWAASGHGDCLYVIGRFAGRLVCEVYDAYARTWELLRPTLTPISFACKVVAVSSKLYIINDEWEDQDSKRAGQSLMTSFCFDIDTHKFERWQPVPTARIECSIAAARQ